MRQTPPKPEGQSPPSSGAPAPVKLAELGARLRELADELEAIRSDPKSVSSVRAELSKLADELNQTLWRFDFIAGLARGLELAFSEGRVTTVEREDEIKLLLRWLRELDGRS